MWREREWEDEWWRLEQQISKLSKSMKAPQTTEREWRENENTRKSNFENGARELENVFLPFAESVFGCKMYTQCELRRSTNDKENVLLLSTVGEKNMFAFHWTTMNCQAQSLLLFREYAPHSMGDEREWNVALMNIPLENKGKGFRNDPRRVHSLPSMDLACCAQMLTWQ